MFFLDMAILPEGLIKGILIGVVLIILGIVALALHLIVRAVKKAKEKKFGDNDREDKK